MSTAAQMKITRNTLSPAIAKAARGLRDTRPVVEAMCLAIYSVTKRAFTQSALRAAPWPALAGGGKASLRRSGELRKGLHVTDVSARQGRVAVNKIYGAVHQFGATITPKKTGGKLAFSIGGKKVFANRVTIPARPFLPFTASGDPTPYARKAVEHEIATTVKSLSGGGFA